MSRTARINPDSRPILIAAVVVTSALIVVSFILSFVGLVEVASWAKVPDKLAFAVPVMFDGAILVYTLAVLVFRSRGESARVAWISLTLWTAVSVAGNSLHAWGGLPEEAKAIVGACVAGLAPIAVLLSTHTLADLIVERVPVEAVEAPETPQDVEDEQTPAPLQLVATPPARRLSGPRPSVDVAERDAAIRKLATEEKLSVREIGAKVGVSKSTVSRVLGRHPDDEEAA